jgi:TetR/AcrR family transcriptional regulator
MLRARTPRKKTRDADASRARVFAAAAEEFAARGFDGAKVDRIAGRAGVNKAMLYYHFTDKAALYRAVVGDMFASTAKAMKQLREAGGTPEAQLAGFIEVVTREGRARRHFPAMWLRELADGGRHLGERNFGDIFGIVSTLAGILHDGEAAGRFRKMPPFLVQMGIVGPLFMFLATSPMRKRLRAKMPAGLPEVSPDVLVDYVKAMTAGALRAGRAGSAGRLGRSGNAGRKGSAGTR